MAKKKATKKKAQRTAPKNKMVGGPGKKAGESVTKVEGMDLPSVTAMTEANSSDVTVDGAWKEADELLNQKPAEECDPEMDDAFEAIEIIVEEKIREMIGDGGVYIKCANCEAYRGTRCCLAPSPQPEMAPDEGCCQGIPKG